MHTVLRPVLLAAALWLAGCGGSAPQPQQTQSAPTPTPAAVSPPSKVNLDEIFPAGRGRELVLNNCTTCHTFVPIVVLQMTKDAWARNSRDHRERVKALSDADFKVLYEYLTANFNPNRPVPRLPQELLETWTSY